MAQIDRQSLINQIDFELSIHPICGLLGPRQCGKTTLAKTYAASAAETKALDIHFFDCEDNRDLARLQNPLLALEPLTGLVIIDEIQNRPDLFPALRVLADQKIDRQFLILGSASPDLLRQSSETLAGRVGFNEVTPFTLSEVKDWKVLMNRGGFPRSYLATSEKASKHWRTEYIRTFLERDLGMMLGHLPSPAVGQLWRMLAHYHGNLLNYSELSRSLGVSSTMVQRYIASLEQTFMVRRLRPWHENLSKREVKCPKVYIRDGGLWAMLMGLESSAEFHPKQGAAFEGLVIEQIITLSNCADKAYFWATHSGAELDLLIIREGKRIGFEVKYTDHPLMTKSMHIALEELKLEHLYVVVPFDAKFSMEKNVTCIGIENLMNEMTSLLDALSVETGNLVKIT